MSGKASGVKGDTFERAIVKFFNLQYSTTQFGKSPSSGARMGKSNFQKNAGLSKSAIDTMISDIITPNTFPYVIECKSYASAPLYHALIKGTERTIDKWLAEVEFDANNVEKLPMLAFKTNNKGTHLMFHSKGIDLSSLEYYVMYREYVLIGIEHFHLIKNQIWDGVL